MYYNDYQSFLSFLESAVIQFFFYIKYLINIDYGRDDETRVLVYL